MAHTGWMWNINVATAIDARGIAAKNSAQFKNHQAFKLRSGELVFAFPSKAVGQPNDEARRFADNPQQEGDCMNEIDRSRQGCGPGLEAGERGKIAVDVPDRDQQIWNQRYFLAPTVRFARPEELAAQ